MQDEGWKHARSVLDSLRRTVRGMRVWVRSCEKNTGLGGAQLFVLQRLAVEGVVSINDLASLTLTDQSTVSVLVKRLVERGLVVRQRCLTDARKSLVRITFAGRQLMAKADRSPQERLIRAVRALPRTESRQLARLLAKVVRNAGFQTEPPGLIFEEKRVYPHRKQSSPREH